MVLSCSGVQSLLCPRFYGSCLNSVWLFASLPHLDSTSLVVMALRFHLALLVPLSRWIPPWFWPSLRFLAALDRCPCGPLPPILQVLSRIHHSLEKKNPPLNSVCMSAHNKDFLLFFSKDINKQPPPKEIIAPTCLPGGHTTSELNKCCFLQFWVLVFGVYQSLSFLDSFDFFVRSLVEGELWSEVVSGILPKPHSFRKRKLRYQNILNAFHLQNSMTVHWCTLQGL